MTNQPAPGKLRVRHATLGDVDGIDALVQRVYPGMAPYPRAMLVGQINSFPDGVWVAELGEQIVGYCATFRISGELALKPHTWRRSPAAATRRATTRGDWLYGTRCSWTRTCAATGSASASTMRASGCASSCGSRASSSPGACPAMRAPAPLRQRRGVRRGGARNKKARDPVLSFQIRNGFEPMGVMHDYLPADRESSGLRGAPGLAQPAGARTAEKRARGAATEPPEPYPRGHRAVHAAPDLSFDEFRAGRILRRRGRRLPLRLRAVSRSCSRCSCCRSTEQELSYRRRGHRGATTTVHRAVPRGARAIRYNINIVAGSTPCRRGDGSAQHRFVFLRDGTVASRKRSTRRPTSATGGTSRAATRCGDPDRLRADRRADLLRRGVSRAGAPPGRPGYQHRLRAVLHRRAPELPARALLLPGPRGREPVLRGDVRQLRQPAQRQQHGHPVRAELHPDPLRLPVRPRRHRRRHHAERGNRRLRGPAPASHCTWRASPARCRTSRTGGTTCTGSPGTEGGARPESGRGSKAQRAAHGNLDGVFLPAGQSLARVSDRRRA
jgi:hypothetical protein